MVSDRLEQLAEQFRARCRSDADALSATANEPASLRSEPLKTTVHKLSGAAGAFGHADLSRLAAAIDDKITHGAEITAAEVEHLLLMLRKVAAS